jgi:hypothetical protein
MKYATPELVVLGSAAALVQGPAEGQGDNYASDMTHPVGGIALGLDD